MIFSSDDPTTNLWMNNKKYKTQGMCWMTERKIGSELQFNLKEPKYHKMLSCTQCTSNCTSFLNKVVNSVP